MGLDVYEEINLVYIKIMYVILNVCRKEMDSLGAPFRVFWLKY